MSTATWPTPTPLLCVGGPKPVWACCGCDNAVCAPSACSVLSEAKMPWKGNGERDISVHHSQLGLPEAKKRDGGFGKVWGGEACIVRRMFSSITSSLLPLLQQYGATGVFLGSIVEEIIAPIPSTMVILFGGFLLVPE